VAIYKPNQKGWYFPIAQKDQFKFENVEAGEFKISFTLDNSFKKASFSKRIDGPSGLWLIKLQSLNSANSESVCISNEQNPTEIVGYIPPLSVSCDFFHFSNTAYLLWNSSGRSYLSFFGSLN